MNIFMSPKHVYKYLILIVLLLFIASFFGQIYKYTIGHDRYLVRLFDMDKEWNIPTLYSVFLLLFSSLLLFAVSRSEKIRKKSKYRYWFFLSIIFMFLAADELISFHEMTISPIRNSFKLSGAFYFSWVLPGIIFTVIIFVCFFNFIFGLPKKVTKLFLLSGIIYVGGAIGVECLGGVISSSYGEENLVYSLITNIEELLEMIGVSIFIYSILHYFETIDGELNIIFNKNIVKP